MENSNVQQNSKNNNYSINCYMFAKENERGLIDENTGALEKAIQDSFMNAKVEENENIIKINAQGQVKEAKRIVNGKEVKAKDLESYKNAYKAQKEQGKTTVIEEEKTI